MTQHEGHANLDPFRDSSEQDDHEPDRLLVGRDASLTLGTDSLIVFDERLAQQRPLPWWLWCSGLFVGRKSPPTCAIPFYNILDAAVNDYDITIRYAQSISPRLVRVNSLAYTYNKSEYKSAVHWVDRLLQHSYGRSKQKKRIKVLVNPFGGRGKAQGWYAHEVEPVFLAAGCVLDVERTRYSGHAAEIAEKLDIDKYDAVACCSGDGLPYEVFNGFGNRKDATRALKSIAVVQVPCGTGNALSLNLNGTSSPSMAALAIVKGIVSPLDLISVTQGDRRVLSFLSQVVGMVAECDLDTEHLRWLGDLRITYGFALRLRKKTIWPCDIAVKTVMDDKVAIKKQYNHAMEAPRCSTNDRVEIERIPTNDLRSKEVNSLDYGLPPLRYGTVQDDLPDGWEVQPYDTLGNFYAGNMSMMTEDTNFFPAALPSDGCLDLSYLDGKVSRLAAIQMFLAVGNGTYFDLPQVSYRKVEAFRVIPRRPENGGRKSVIAIDGERFPCEPFQVEVHKGLGTVLSKRGRLYEVPPLK